MTTTKTKVLLVDDEKFLLDVYSIKFLKSGFDVFISTSAREGLEAMHKGYIPDAVLFDINMPEKSGFEFLEELHSFPWHSSCLKIALTNEGQDAGIERIAELGADAFFLKANYTPAQLVDAVTVLLGKKHYL